tara:strand:+ start:149 stop:322 length:174 start_codon:yes stop_codon:yes gene_type:complete
MKENEMNEEYDDDYTQELHEDRKRARGWARCDDCGEWLHMEDLANGLGCQCEEGEGE